MTLKEFSHIYMSDCLHGEHDTAYIFDDDETMDIWIQIYHGITPDIPYEDINVVPRFTLYGEQSWWSYLNDKYLNMEVDEFEALGRNKIAILLKENNNG